jgi:prepilin-type N-terminal cleavage/methylation domain-containing protein
MKERFSRKTREEGFTLFELLIVIIILAILAAIVAFATGSSTANAATSSCQSDAKSFGTALEEYKSSVGVFPGDPSLQVQNGSNQPLTSNGQTWGTGAAPQLPNTWGLLGSSSPDGSWTAPNGVLLGPLMRQLPSTQHYKIWTDGQGGVFVYPPAGHIPINGATMDGQNVNSVTGDGDTNSLNFETDPAICSDPNVVK